MQPDVVNHRLGSANSGGSGEDASPKSSWGQSDCDPFVLTALALLDHFEGDSSREIAKDVATPGDPHQE